MNIPEIEKKILQFWQENKIFEKSLKKKSPKGDFVFYEGPPTANGKPGIHHVLARAFKDLIPRYKTMRGYYVERKAGWDTHGLPVELEVEKLLGLKSKKDIENYGIEKFNQKCKESVWKYKEEWEKMTERIGFWIDMKNPYITYENDYIESLWWIVKQVNEKGLLYKDYKVVPYCPRCGTTLSSHEVAQGYKKIKENSIYIKFQVEGQQDTYLLVWTTTPWTLPGNIALAINRNINYVKVKEGDEFLILAENRLQILKEDYKIIERTIGRDFNNLTGTVDHIGRYKQILPLSSPNPKKSFIVVFADFVSDQDGTGIVHIAPTYGEDDMNLANELGLEKYFMYLDKEGKFQKDFPWRGKFAKDADNDIIQELKKRNLLYKEELYEHDYPFCWRCDSPLLYYAKESWFINMQKVKKDLISNNQKINWIPAHLKEGRFGEWLREVKDWAISRERYWGTPIPVWICEKCGEMKVIGSRKELSIDKNFDLHRPFIDEIKLKCKKCKGEMKRIPEVMDCWFDSGAMPFAQYHYPFENKDLIDKGKQYPADFICEAMDQTRGWFYTLLAVSTILDKGTSYKNVISLGLVLDKNGQKMSKHLGNIIDPWLMIEKYGADVLRWYFYTINQPGETKRFNENNLKESSKIFITLLNVLNFYKMFANKEIGNLKERDLDNILDKWIISKLNLLIQNNTEALDKYDITTSARRLEEFINDLSVWYLRRSRERIKDGDKEAIKTLKYVLLELSKIIAPVMPFIADYIYKESGGEKESVHLEDWPRVNKKLINKKLEEKMEQVRNICSLALQARAEKGIKVRQPLQQLTVNKKQLTVELVNLIKDEINVKDVVFDPKLKEKIKLDTEISEELKEEGMVRDFVRSIQALRKEAGLTPQDKIKVYYSENKDVIEKYKNQIKKQVIAEEVVFGGDGLKIKKI